MATNAMTTNSDLEHMSGQFSTFFVDDLFFGVDVLDVQEVLRAQQMTPVPQAPDVVEGLINLRGQIVTAIDMRRRLLLPPRGTDQAPMNMVVRTSDGAVSLLVDEIGDVLDMDAATFERPPENLDSAARELIRGVYKLNDQLLLVLDTERAVEAGNCQSSRNSGLDAQPSETALARRRMAPAEGLVTELADPTSAKTSQKRGIRKAPAKRTNSAPRSAGH